MIRLSEIAAQLESIDPGKVYRYRVSKVSPCTVWQEDTAHRAYGASNQRRGALLCTIKIARFAPPAQTRDATAMAIIDYLCEQGLDPSDTVTYDPDLDLIVHAITAGDVIYDA